MKLTKEEEQSLRKRIELKIKDIERYTDDLLSFKPETLEEYEANSMKRAACERCCEKISEAIIDLAILLIRFKEINYVDEDEKAFSVLLKNNLINESLYKRLHNLRGMRDHLAHRYGEINNEIVFNAIDNELEKDISEFLDIIEKSG